MQQSDTMRIPPINVGTTQRHIGQRLGCRIDGRRSDLVPARPFPTFARQGWGRSERCAWTSSDCLSTPSANSCTLRRGIIAGSSQHLPKILDVIFKKVFPEKGTHMQCAERWK